MSTLGRWVWRVFGASTLVTFALLWLVFAASALALREVVRGFDVTFTLALMMLGSLVGWVLARDRFPGWLVAFIALLLGGEMVLVRVGQLGDELVVLAQNLVVVARASVTVPRGAPLDFAPTIHAGNELANASAVLLARVRDWLVALARGAPVYDPVASALVWSLLAWCIAAWASWHTFRRHRALTALVPLFALVAGVIVYGGGNPDFLLPLLAALLVLFVVRAQSEREHHWQATQVPTAEDIPFDLAVVGVSLTIGLLISAALMPSLSLDEVIRWTQDWTRERPEVNRVSESFGLPPAPATRAPTIFDALRAPGLPTRHLVGSGVELSRLVVMTIQTDDTRVESADEYTAPPHYWRSATYDVYTGRGWLTSETEIVDYAAGELAHSATDSTHRTVQQEIRRVREASHVLFATGTLATTDHDYRVAWRTAGDAFGAEIRATTYRAETRVLALDAERLRVSGANYPADLRARYLALPDDVPVRVLNLARDLTATQPTPYDRARAIEKYLREFPYTLTLPAPPANRDVVDYFLFDLQKGYCDYFASAMVVLARAAGIPARLVIGYAPGSFDSVNARYIVTEADAHAWAELYFADVGWVEFEATSNRPAFEYSPQASAGDTNRLPKADEALINLPLTNEMDWRGWMGASIALVFGAGVAAFAFDEWRLRWLAPHASIRKIYPRLVWCGARLGVRARVSDTPREFAERLAGVDAHTLAPDVNALIDAYVICEYSPHKPDKTAQLRVLKEWRHVRGELLRVWIRRWRLKRE